MKIAKQTTIEEIGPATWTAFAEEIGLAAAFVRRRVRELAGAANAHLSSVADGTPLAALDASALKEYGALISSRAGRLGRTGRKLSPGEG
jgi:hypothetical protein